MRALAIALSLVLAAPAVAQPKDQKPPPAKPASLALQLLDKVEANYKAPQHLTATFEQVVTNAVSGAAQPTGGTFRVEKPDKLKFEFLIPKRTDGRLKFTYLIDGKSYWVVDHLNKQVGQQPVSQTNLPTFVGFFLGVGTLARDFKVAVTSDKAFVPDGATGLELTPKQPSAAYARVILVLDKSSHVTRTVIVDSSGNTQAMTFTKVELDKPAPPGTFKLDPKSVAGWRVVKP